MNKIQLLLDHSKLTHRFLSNSKKYKLMEGVS